MSENNTQEDVLEELNAFINDTKGLWNARDHKWSCFACSIPSASRYLRFPTSASETIMVRTSARRKRSWSSATTTRNSERSGFSRSTIEHSEILERNFFFSIV
uniref:Uncharacterized protein n=1 Tax=Trichogramma kaykai TaxID=54128 RepID=A0ABD2WD27_9HYME